MKLNVDQFTNGVQWRSFSYTVRSAEALETKLADIYHGMGEHHYWLCGTIR